jgi:hypothetical protein
MSTNLSESDSVDPVLRTMPQDIIVPGILNAGDIPMWLQPGHPATAVSGHGEWR